MDSWSAPLESPDGREAGLRFGERGTHTSRTMMLAELSELLRVTPVDSTRQDYLDAIGANDISDVATFTPNLEIRTPFAASNPTLFIRGVGIRDFNANSSSSVAVYNDEIFMNSPAAQLASSNSGSSKPAATPARADVR